MDTNFTYVYAREILKKRFGNKTIQTITENVCEPLTVFKLYSFLSVYGDQGAVYVLSLTILNVCILSRIINWRSWNQHLLYYKRNVWRLEEEVRLYFGCKIKVHFRGLLAFFFAFHTVKILSKAFSPV